MTIPCPEAERAYGDLPTPDRDIDRTISHLLATACSNTGHLDVHAAAAAAARDPVLLAHHLHHALGHARSVSSHLVKLRVAVIRRVPAIGQQLDDLDQAIPGSRAVTEHVPLAALDMSIAHDLATAQGAAAHVDRHLSEAQMAQSAGNKVSVAFNIEHAVHHIAEVAHSLDELDNDLSRKLPSVATELGSLHAAADPVSGSPPPAPARAAMETDYDVVFRDYGPQPA